MAYVPPHRRSGVGEQSRKLLSVQNSKEKSTPFLDHFSRIFCINLDSRPEKWQRFRNHARRVIGPALGHKLERFNAVDGREALETSPRVGVDVTLEWDSSTNALWDRHVRPGLKLSTAGEIGCSLSHISLWRTFVDESGSGSGENGNDDVMLIFEDDAELGRSFLQAFSKAWGLLPSDGDWDIFYLGFSDRGERVDVVSSNTGRYPDVDIFRPTYGFHTHAYAIKRKASSRLLDNIPIAGPVDVWLADNKWFGMKVYCAIYHKRGDNSWSRGLVHQCRAQGSDIKMSGRSQGESDFSNN